MSFAREVANEAGSQILKLIALVCLVSVIGIISAFYAGKALAEDRVDQIEQYDPDTYCKVVTTLFAYGIDRHNEGVPLTFKHKDPKVDGSKDAIYVTGLDAMTDQERAFVTEHMTNGWQFADKLVESDKYGKGIGFSTQVDTQLAAGYYNKCLGWRADDILKKRTSYTPANIKTQSRFLQNGEAQREECMTWRSIAFDMVQIARLPGVTEEKFWEENPLPENFSDDAADHLRAIVHGAFAWTGEPAEYADGIFAQCMDVQQ